MKYLLALLFLQAPLYCCTDFQLTAEDKSEVVGRSMEFALNLRSEVVLHPQGEKYSITLTNPHSDPIQGLSWTSKYGYLAVNAFGLDLPVDGMNEKGLSFGALWFPGAEYQKVPAGKESEALLLTNIGNWLLGNFATVDEARAGLEKVYLFAEPIAEFGNTIPPCHISLHDATGKSIVIEFIKGEKVISDNPVRILTNAPYFEWHVVNLSNYINLNAMNAGPVKIGNTVIDGTGQGSGFLGIPGDWTPPSRFVRIAAYKQFAKRAKNSTDVTILALHLLNTVDIPLGDVQEKNNTSDYTQWVVIKDLTNKNFYVRSYEDPNLYQIDMSKLNMAPNAPQVKMTIPTTTKFVNATTSMIPVEVKPPEAAGMGVIPPTVPNATPPTTPITNFR